MKVQDVQRDAKCAGMEASAKDTAGANQCSANADAGSRKVFEDLVADEERHYSQYDIEAVNLEKFGERYLALQSIEGSKKAGSAPA